MEEIGLKAKKPKSSYLAFYKEELNDRSKHSAHCNLVKEISDKWNGMSEEDKKVYKERYASERTIYLRNKDNQISQGKELGPIYHNKLIRPKFARTAYQIFQREGRIFNKREVIKEAAARWIEMSDEEKQQYTEKADCDKIRFDKEWKGYIDEFIDIKFKSNTAVDKDTLRERFFSLNKTYGRAYVFQELSKLINIMLMLNKKAFRNFGKKKRKQKYVFTLGRIKKE